MAENKTVETDASVADFLAGVENDTRRRDGLAVLELMREVSGVERRSRSTGRRDAGAS